MPDRLFQLLQGTPVTTASTVQLLPSGLAGERGAIRRLVHPDGDTFPVLTYYRNPDRTFNFDRDVLRQPITATQRTLTSTKVIRFEELEEDVIVTERWEAAGGVSMPIFFLRQLYEYLVNPPAFAIPQPYIIWEPRDNSDDTYRVEILRVQAGGGSPGSFDISVFTTRGGPTDPTNPGVEGTPSDTLDPALGTTSFLTTAVDITMRIVEKV